MLSSPLFLEGKVEKDFCCRSPYLPFVKDIWIIIRTYCDACMSFTLCLNGFGEELWNVERVFGVSKYMSTSSAHVHWLL